MKKRKIKLFASVASLAMVAAVMGVGVWAATTQSVGVSSTITFSGSNVAATVSLQVSGTEGKLGDQLEDPSIITSATLSEAVSLENMEETNLLVGAPIADFEIAESTANHTSSVKLVLEDGNEDGMITQGAEIVYTFTIEPGDGTATLAYDVTVTDGEKQIQGFKYQINEVAENSPATNVTGNTLTVTFTATENHANIQDVAKNFYNVNIAFHPQA